MFWLFIAIGFVAVYIFLGWSVQRFLPPQTPHLQQYFTPGMRFASKLEGMEHTIVRVTKTHVHTLTTLRPHAQGPPVHVHMLMDESFQVVSGELSLEIGGTIKSYTEAKPFLFQKLHHTGHSMLLHRMWLSVQVHKDFHWNLLLAYRNYMDFGIVTTKINSRRVYFGLWQHSILFLTAIQLN